MRTFKVFLLGIGMSISTLSFAQQQADKILTIDNTKIEGRVLEITETLIRYKDFYDAQGIVKTIAKTQVYKITYSNGYIEEYNSVSAPATAQDEALQQQNLQLYGTGNDNNQINQTQDNTAIPQQETEEVFGITTGKEKKAVIRERQTTGLIVGLGLAAAYMLGDSPWVSEEGMGFRQGFGGSARLQYTLPSRKLGFMGTVGYSQWSVRRVFGPEEEITLAFKNLSVSAGIKTYFGGGFYFSIEGGLHNLQLGSETVIDSEVEAASENTSEIGIAGGVGYEFLAGPLLLDISGKYNLIGIGLNPDYEDLGNIGFIGVRLGIGYIVL